MQRSRRAVTSGAVALLCSTALFALPVRAMADAGEHGQVLSVRSLSDMRWENVVRQRLEVACGAASLATIMTYYFGYPTTEQEMADALAAEAQAEGQGDLVRQLGFSMLHIVRVAEKGGLVAKGFRIPIEHIDRIRIPVIARVSIRGYDHFLVFKGAQNGRVFVADPAFGNGSYRLASFEKIWSGLMLGFLRRGQAPQGHALGVQDADELGPVWEQATERTISSLVDPTWGMTRAFASQSFEPPALQTLVPGLESAFPRMLITLTEF